MKNSKKLAMFITALAMCSSAAFFAACGDNSTDDSGKDPGTVVTPPVDDNPAHEHHYNWVVTTDPTCEDDGVETGTCPDDGETTTRSVDALGHKYGEWETTKEPTCDTDGEKQRVCANDPTHIEKEPISALKHSYGEWETTTEPTCETAGEKQRVCANDPTHIEKEPISALEHSYGDWSVTTLPKKDATGVATKVCSHDSDHKITVTLPALSDVDAYESVVEGEETHSYVYTFECDNGDIITFTAYEGSLDLVKAVEFAVSNMDKVTNGVITKNSQMGENPETSNSVVFGYGDDYMYIRDAGTLTAYDGYVRMYIDKIKDSDGNTSYFFPFVVTSGSGTTIYNGEKSLDLDLDNIYDVGVPYTLMYDEHPLTMGVTFYGAGNLINALYTVGKSNVNGDFTESVTENGDGTFTYSFSFGYKGSTYGLSGADTESGVAEGYFHVYEVSFTLNDDYVLTSATIVNRGYVNSVKDPDTGAITNNHNYELVDGQYVLTEKATALYTQTMEIVHNSPDTVIPENPYKYEDFVITSFDVTLDGDTLDSGAEIDFNATSSKTLYLENIVPETFNPNFDEIKMYIENEDGEFEECAFMYESDDYHVKVNYVKNDPVDGTLVNSITINPYVSGDKKLLIKTENLEFVINLHIEAIAPTSDSFLPSVYKHDVVTDKTTWQSMNNYSVYAGQPLAFTTTVTHPAYEEAGFTVKVTNADGDDVTDSVMTTSIVEGVDVSVFKADTAGNYTVTLSNKKVRAIMITLNVTVSEAPAVSDILDGTYKNDDNNVTLVFTPSASGAVSGSAVITKGDDDVSATRVNYEYHSANRTITVTYAEGADLNYELLLTDDYNLVLSYKDAFGYANKMLLFAEDKIVDTVSGTYDMPSMEDAAKASPIYVSTTGVYRFSADSYKLPASWGGDYNLLGKIKPDGGDQYGDQFYIYEATDMLLEAGQQLIIWQVMASSGATYTLEYIGPYVEASEVTLDKTQAEITVGGDNLTLTATVGPENAFDKKITWSTSDANVASVDQNGVVTAKWEGEVTITATLSNGLSASCTVTVNMVHVTEITLEETSITVEYGQQALVVPVITPDDASVKTFTVSFDSDYLSYTWNSDKTGINIRPVKEGNTTVTFTTTDGEKTVVLNVTITMTHAESVSLDKTDAVVYINEKITLNTVFTPEDASRKDGTWSSSDATVATVSSVGVVTGYKAGTTTITFTAADGGLTASCEVTVKYKPLNLGENEQFSAVRNITYPFEFKGDPNTAYLFRVNGTASYTFSQVKPDGTILNGPTNSLAEFTTDENGSLIVRLKSTVAAFVSITVGKSLPIESVEFDKTAIELFVNSTETLALTFNPSAECIKDVGGTWSSSDTSVATVSSTGVVKGVNAGTATITFTSNDGEHSASCTVTVNTMAAESVSFDNATVEVGYKSSVGLTVTFNPANTSDKTGTWQSSDTSIATVDGNGLVTGEGSGTATITFTSNDGGFIATCEVTVIKNSITESGDYGADEGIGWDNNPYICYLVVAEGESWTITDKENAYLKINGKAVSTPVILAEAGEYRIELYHDDMFTPQAWFTATKN